MVVALIDAIVSTVPNAAVGKLSLGKGTTLSFTSDGGEQTSFMELSPPCYETSVGLEAFSTLINPISDFTPSRRSSWR